ncbi:MAG: histidine phosphatase family protein [Rhodospirillales bacterium]|nr:histidine phosphatase family protein [Rhodospirillales bacterium]
MTPLALIRHGPTGWNQEKRLQGHADRPLSPEGEEKVAGWSVPAEFRDYKWFASPLTRAQQTAAALQLVPETEPAIIEMDWGAWEGHTIDELRETYGDEIRRRTEMGLDLRPHDGESPRDVRDRVGKWATGIGKTGQPTGAVAHQGIIRALLSLATGWEMVGEPPHKMDWASVHLFEIAADGAVCISRLNISLENKLK